MQYPVKRYSDGRLEYFITSNFSVISDSSPLARIKHTILTAEKSNKVKSYPKDELKALRDKKNKNVRQGKGIEDDYSY